MSLYNIPIHGIPRSWAIPIFNFTKDQLVVQIGFTNLYSTNGI